MNFKDWLFKEGGKGSGTKFSGTGASGVGGMSQHGRVYRPSLLTTNFKIKNKIKKVKTLFK